MYTYNTFGYYWTKITDTTDGDLCTFLMPSRQNTQENTKDKNADEVSSTQREK